MTSFGEHIEGETPIYDLSGLKIDGIATRAELNYFEALNINKAHVKYLTGRLTKRTAPFTYEWCLKLHKHMFGDVWKWAGKIRTEDVNIGSKFYAVPEHLASLVEDIAFRRTTSMSHVEQAAMIHHRAVQIHPFLNGNGRWARMLANIWMRLNGQPITQWPEEVIGTSSVVRQEYISAIKKADDSDLDDLIAMHTRFSDT